MVKFNKIIIYEYITYFLLVVEDEQNNISFYLKKRFFR